MSDFKEFMDEILMSFEEFILQDEFNKLFNNKDHSKLLECYSEYLDGQVDHYSDGSNTLAGDDEYFDAEKFIRLSA